MTNQLEIQTTRVYEENFVTDTSYKIFLNRGGTRSGKTFNLEIGFAWRLITGRLGEEYIEEGILSIVRKWGTTLKATAMRDLEEILDMWGLKGMVKINKTDRTYTVGKRMIEFFGADDAQKLKGSKRKMLYCNECNELDYKTEFFQLLIRTEHKVFIDFNPDDEYCRMNLELEQKRALTKKDVKVIVSTYKDNFALSQAQIEEIENIKNIDPVLRKIYGEGAYGKMEGVIFENWEVVDKVPESAKSIGYGLDFGFANDPTALTECYLDDDTLYLDELIYQTGLTNDDLCERMRELGVSYDDEIIADSSEPKSIEEIYREGFNIHPAVKGPDSIRHGIGTMKKFKIKITARSVNLHKEFRTYLWAKDRLGNCINKPIDKDNHGIDGVRYRVQLRFSDGAQDVGIGFIY